MNLVGLFVSLAFALSAAEPVPDPKELPRIPFTSVENARKTFTVKEGIELQLAAAEPLVVDPVMLSTSGAMLLKPSAAKVLQKKLLPVAKLVTPNVPEAEALTGLRIREPEDLRTAARALFEKYGCAVLVKGGHLRGLNEAVDVLFDGREEWLFSLPRVKGRGMHGTGCVYSAAITAGLVKGLSLPKSVEQGKEFVTHEMLKIE